MDNFSVRSERNFHNLIVKPNHMTVLKGPPALFKCMKKI